LLDHSAGESLFGSAPASVVDSVRALNRAKNDDKIKGLLIRTGFGMAPASAEEIRLAIRDFKESGKFVIAHSQGFESTSIIPYMAVSASDEIWQQATTGFAVAGLYSESGFYGGVFEKYDAKAEFVQFYEYKNAANTYTQSTMTEVSAYGPGINVTGPVIAFIGGQGPVTMGGSQDGSNPFSSAVSMGSDTLSKALKKAADDKKVKAIIFRVSSPGGSATASDEIYDAVELAKEADKPVIISMGQYAASGGYYVAANADKIIAMPTTITGSIGVVGGKVALRDAYSKIGYNVEHVRIGGEYGGAYSGDEPFTQAQRKAFTDQSLREITNLPEVQAILKARTEALTTGNAILKADIAEVQ